VKLAYDLRYATDHFPGIGTHARGLAGAILERPAIESVTFLWDPRARNSRFDLEPLRRHPRARWLDVPVPALAMGTAAATGRLLSRLSPDLFVSPFWLRPERTRVPSVLTLFDVIPLAMPATMDWSRRWAYRWAMRRAAGAAAVLTGSRFSRDEIARLTPIPAECIHVVPSAPMPATAAPVRPAGAPDAPFALVVAANRAHKGLDTLAAAWRALGAAPPLALVGAGAWSPERFSLVDAAREQPDVHALGAVPPGELEWLYRNAALVLVPSRYEGFGLPLLEASARGAAVLASDIPPLRETGEGVARFVPAGDPAAWAAAVRELAADPAARAHMGQAGRARAEEYTFARSAERLEALLQDLLAGAAA
jgi:glycosyltransferase involved in cell wall biosynthesis